MFAILNKIKRWYWWKFKASEIDKSFYDLVLRGTGMMKNGKRIDPSVFYRTSNLKEKSIKTHNYSWIKEYFNKLRKKMGEKYRDYRQYF